jgi:hypothetical protein
MKGTPSAPFPIVKFLASFAFLDGKCSDSVKLKRISYWASSYSFIRSMCCG